jgi:transcriptional regulator with XRE-family HTH domain
MIKEENQDRFKAVGDRIKELRVKAGYSSHEQFAYDNSLQAKQVWRLESGKFDIKLSTLLRLLNIHGITLEEFFKGLK